MAVSKVDAANQIENKLPQANIAGNVNFRNIVINGDMSIAQRGTSTASLSSTDSYPACDRWRFAVSGAGTWTVSQSTDVPSGQGFSNSLKLDCTSATASPASGAYLQLLTRFEGQNLQYIKKGTSSAQILTLSFWVKCNKTGNQQVAVRDNDNTRVVCPRFTINSADTWEKKTLEIPADTTGTLGNDNGNSFALEWWLDAGSDFTSGTRPTAWEAKVNTDLAVDNLSLASSTDNEFYITGVQLEAGTTASDFEFLPHDVNLNRCLRYFEKIADGGEDADGVIGSGGYIYQTNVLGINYQWYPKRSTPSIYQTSGTSYFRFQRSGGTDDFNQVKLYIPNYLNGLMYSDDGISGSANTNGWVQINNSSAYLGLNAEL